MVLGIDLSRAYAQVSIYDKKNSTVDTLELLKCDNSCNIPTQLCKKKGLDEWYVGDEARRLELLSEGVIVDDIVTKVITKEEIIVDNVGVSYNTLMTHFLKKLIELVCPVGEVEYLTICFEEFTINLLDSVRKALEKLEVDLTKVEFINRSESDMYYVLSQNKDIWYGNVALFDYSAKGLIVSILEVHKNNGSEIVVINEHDFSAELPYISGEEKYKETAINDTLIKISDKLFEKRIVSAIFLTGIGFESEISYDMFIKHVCGRRRMFIGQNIYSKGACYSSMEMRKPGSFADRTLLCADKILYELDMDITERGKQSRLRIVKPGINWYKARRKFDFFVDGESELVFRKKMFGEDDIEVITIGLLDIPNRPNKATKLCIGFDFESDGKLKVTVKDKGFGSLFKSSGVIIEKVI